MRGLRAMLTVVVAMVVAGCSSRVARESGGDVDIGSRTMRGGDRGGDLRGIGGWSDVRGSAYVRHTDTGMTVSLTIERGVPGGAYAWEIREGKCGGEGRAVVEVAALPGVFIDETGRGSAVGMVTAKLAPGTEYHVNVFTSPDRPTNPIACGSLIE